VNIVFDMLPDDACPRYETSVGEKIMMAKPSGYKTKNATDKRVLVPMYPVTSKMLRGTADMLDYAKKNNLQSFCIVLHDSKMGALAL